MKVLQSINDFFSKKNLIIFILGAAVVILSSLYLKSCGDLKAQKALAEQNAEAMKKELTVEKNKNGELQTSIVAYEGRIKDVEKYSKELAEDIKALKKRKPEVIIRTQLVYVGDTTKVNNQLTDKGNGDYDLDWQYTSPDTSRILKGTSSFNAKVNIFDNKTFSINILPGTTKITQDILKIEATVGVVKNKKTGFDEIFVTPKNPNITVGKLEGAILNKPNKNDFSVSAQLGYGIVYGKGNLTFGPYVGVGLSYNLLGGIKKIFKR